MSDPKDLPEEFRGREPNLYPFLALTHERLLCALHGEPFRKEWPLGFAPFFSLAWDAALKAKLLEPPAGLETKQQVGWIELQLSERPLCCRLERGDLVRAFLGARKWKRRMCFGCRELREGSPFRVVELQRSLETMEEREVVVERSHVCLWCCAFRMSQRPHDGSPL